VVGVAHHIARHALRHLGQRPLAARERLVEALGDLAGGERGGHRSLAGASAGQILRGQLLEEPTGVRRHVGFEVGENRVDIGHAAR
jgi:hypothetical protein